MGSREMVSTPKGAEYNVQRALANLRRNITRLRRAAGAVECSVQGFDALSIETKEQLTQEVNELSIDTYIQLLLGFFVQQALSTYGAISTCYTLLKSYEQNKNIDESLVSHA